MATAEEHFKRCIAIFEKSHPKCKYESFKLACEHLSKCPKFYIFRTLLNDAEKKRSAKENAEIMRPHGHVVAAERELSTRPIFKMEEQELLFRMTTLVDFRPLQKMKTMMWSMSNSGRSS